MDDTSSGEGQKSRLRIQLLGGFTVSVGNIIIAESQWKSRRARTLIKLLALAPSHRLHRDQVIDTLWPDSDLSSAANSFYQSLLVTRRVFGPDGASILQMEDGFLNLCSGGNPPVVVDVEQFGQAAARAKASQDAANEHAVALYQSAVNLYQGDLLPDDLYEEWTIQRREELRQVFLKLLLDLSRLYEAREAYARGVDTIQRFLAADRSNEDAHAELMRLYAFSGLHLLALRQYQTLKELLRVEFDTEPSGSITQLFEQIRSGQFATRKMQNASPPDGAILPPAHAFKHNLPAQLTSFIGREREIADVRRQVQKHRLVTLTGVGGTGKTRLALKVAERLLDIFPDGVFLVELASLSDPELVPQACAQALEVSEQPGKPMVTAMVNFLSKKHSLLILDNCEHLISACTQLVVSLLKGCPQLHILTTSREILSAPGESPFSVPSLTVPRPGQIPPLAELAQVESVRLFVERAAQFCPDFTLAAENAGAVVQICQRLDGIPLAIELASARVRMLPAEQIADRLDNAFSLLTGGSRAALPRQQTLKATIDWSYQLLAPKERLLLQRLSVFAGGWTLEEVEAVAAEAAGEEASGPDPDRVDGRGEKRCPEEQIKSFEVVDLLAQLVDKSLIIVGIHAGQARCHLLETIRQYAFDRLAESGCGRAVRDRHLEYFLHLAEEIAGWLNTTRRLDGLGQLAVEKDNLRAALGWALAGTKGRLAEQGLRLATALSFRWTSGTLLNEGETWLRKGLETSLEVFHPDNPNRNRLRASALRALGDIQFMQGNKDRAIATVNESIALFHRLDDPAGLANALAVLGGIYYMFDIAQAWKTCEQAEAILRSLVPQPVNQWNLARLLILMGNIVHQAGDPSGAMPYYFESISLFEDAGDSWSTLEPLGQLANTYSETGDLERLRECRNRFMVIHNELKDRPIYGNYLWHLGLMAYALQDYAQMEADFLVSSESEQKVDNHWAVIWGSRMLAIAAKRQGQPAKAARYCLKGLNRAVEIDDPYGVRTAISLMAGFVAVEQPRRSARLLGAVQALFETFTKPMDRHEAIEFERDSATARAQLSEEIFQSAWAEGREMKLEQAIQEARAIEAEITK